MLSIIVPVYNSEKHLPRALESILAQTHKDFEAIVVNDGSEGNCDAIVECFSRKDSRIRSVKLRRNEGLFKARVAGVREASGEYAAFVDSDDYISGDYFRVLLESAAANGADVVAGKTVMERNGKKYVLTLMDNLFTGETLDGEMIKKRFFGGQGQNHLWHNVWNKIYSRDLLSRCLPFHQRLDRHLVMTEDIAFSFPLMYFARKMAFVGTECYHYVQHDESSVSMAGIDFSRMRKRIQDVAGAFAFVESFLDDVGATADLRKDFDGFRLMYHSMYKDAVCNFLRSRISKENRIRLNEAVSDIAPDFARGLDPRDLCWKRSVDDRFCHTITTKCSDSPLTAIKEKIAHPQCEYVSFAVFDTLVVKPFLRPDDLFALLAGKYEELAGGNGDIQSIRAEAENAARKAALASNLRTAGVDLDAVYREISSRFGVSESVTDSLKEEERRLELRFCRRRETAMELFTFAKAMKKKIIIVSDTCHNGKTIDAILKQNGYSGYDRLFLASEHGVTKQCGTLFQKALDELGIAGGALCHVGDDPEGDRRVPSSLGIAAFLFPRPADLLRGEIEGTKTNDCFSIGGKVYGPLGDPDALERSIGYRGAQALVANRYFDNPYRAFNPESDFNADPYLIGYYPLAMHMLGLAAWIARKCRANGYERIHFLGRDGFLPLKFFEKLAPHFRCETRADYMHGSRRALMPAYFTSPRDFFDSRLNEDCRALKTPAEMLKMFGFCARNITEAELRNLVTRNGFSPDEPFGDDESYRKFISFFLGELYDPDRHVAARRLLERYFDGKIGDRDVFFDIGYNGSTPTALSALSDRTVNMLYVHAGGDEAANAQRRHGFNLDCFYDLTPAVSGTLREHLLSEITPSCVGFEDSNGSPLPLFDKETRNCQDAMVVEAAHRGALQFLDDFLDAFSGRMEFPPFRSHEVSMPFEAFLRMPNDNDLKVFGASYFNDDLYTRRNIYETLKEKLLWDFVKNRSRFTQFAVYLFLDRSALERHFRDISRRYSPVPRFFINLMAWLMRIIKA